jgi:hypothetical protein
LLKFSVPKQVYIIVHPNKKIPEINEPKIKYFKPASIEKAEFFLKLAKT